MNQESYHTRYSFPAKQIPSIYPFLTTLIGQTLYQYFKAFQDLFPLIYGNGIESILVVLVHIALNAYKQLTALVSQPDAQIPSISGIGFPGNETLLHQVVDGPAHGALVQSQHAGQVIDRNSASSAYFHYSVALAQGYTAAGSFAFLQQSEFPGQQPDTFPQT
jgi:hypothetical protein